MPTPERRPALTKADTKAHPVAPPVPNAQSATELPAPVPEMTARTDPQIASALDSGRTAMLSARVPIELRDEVKIYAARHRMTVQEILTAAVEQYLDE
jgi:hypothetical protein